MIILVTSPGKTVQARRQASARRGRRKQANTHHNACKNVSAGGGGGGQTRSDTWTATNDALRQHTNGWGCVRVACAASPRGSGAHYIFPLLILFRTGIIVDNPRDQSRRAVQARRQASARRGRRKQANTHHLPMPTVVYPTSRSFAGSMVRFALYPPGCAGLHIISDTPWPGRRPVSNEARLGPQYLYE